MQDKICLKGKGSETVSKSWPHFLSTKGNGLIPLAPPLDTPLEYWNTHLGLSFVQLLCLGGINKVMMIFTYSFFSSQEIDWIALVLPLLWLPFVKLWVIMTFI